jgi:hypothetical protein
MTEHEALMNVLEAIRQGTHTVDTDTGIVSAPDGSTVPKGDPNVVQALDAYIIVSRPVDPTEAEQT